MNLDRLLRIVKPVAARGALQAPAGRVTDDSRAVTAGDCFVAVRGVAHDGHHHIADALARGASVVVCETYEGPEPGSACILLVKDTRRILLPLALAAHGDPQKRLTLVGVTGTNGKTTVTTLVWQILTRVGTRAALIGTVSKIFGTEEVGSRLTTPGAVELAADLKRALDSGCTHVVMEVSSHALDQHRTKGLKFAAAVFTNLTHDHLDYHGGMEAYAKAKSKLFAGLGKNATAILNADSPWHEAVAGRTKADRWHVGVGDGSLKVLEANAGGQTLDVAGTVLRTPLVGDFNSMNVAQAYLTAVALGLNAAGAAAALAEAPGAPGRLEAVRGGTESPAVFVDYAHTPDAMENVLATLRALTPAGRRLHCVFGCGGDRDRTKRPKMGAIAERLADRVIVTSDNPRTEDPDRILNDVMAGFGRPQAALLIADRAQAIRTAITTADAGDLVLIAGKGHETYQDIRGVKHDFDDRIHARNALNGGTA